MNMKKDVVLFVMTDSLCLISMHVCALLDKFNMVHRTTFQTANPHFGPCERFPDVLSRRRRRYNIIAIKQ